jgi:EAL domain-containing protein (putative c-di-GMP-specific phosphodiesterase class I)/GGDEF domain-containing protein
VAVYLDDVRFVFQPLYSLHTGGMAAVEALARPAGCTPRELLGRARSAGHLIETDIELAARAIESEAHEQTLLPLHVNLLAVSAASPDALRPIVDAMTRAGRRAKEIVVEVGPPFTQTDPKALVDGIARLHELGFQVALDGLGVGDLPLGVLAAAGADMLKVDRALLRRLPVEPAAVAIAEALLHIANSTDARLVATGIERPEELEAARDLGIRFMQGNLFAQAQQRLSLHTVLAPATTHTDAEPSALSNIAVPTIADFIRPPATLPAHVSCDDARQALAANDEPTTMVGIDEAGRPRWTIDRSRFLLAISGRYGHALHASKPAERFADVPHTIPAQAGALELLDMVADAEADRMYDDIVVIDRAGVCLGVVRVAEVVRGVAEVKIAEAATLNPLTGLPSSETIANDVDRRISIGEPFVAACLDVDHFRRVNDRAGFAAGDELIRGLGRTLTDLAAQLPRTTVSHVGGDDFLIAADMDELGTLAPALLDTRWAADGMPVSITLAGLVCAPGSVASYAEASRLLAGLRQRSKKLSANNWVLGRPGVERIDVIRGRLAEQGVA